eukprot:CFRG7133T1
MFNRSNILNMTAPLSVNDNETDSEHVFLRSNSSFHRENPYPSAALTDHTHSRRDEYSSPRFPVGAAECGRAVSWVIGLHCFGTCNSGGVGGSPSDQLEKNALLAMKSLPTNRTTYEELVEKHLTQPREKARIRRESEDLNINNPLSTAKENPWVIYYQDEDLKAEIEMDVSRTYQELDFFQRADILQMLNTLLFIYSKENPNLSYRQGMHELLAPLLWVRAHHTSSPEKDHSSNVNRLSYILTDKFIEHDTYSMFVKLMKLMKRWYEMPAQSANGLRRTSIEEMPVVAKIVHIQMALLAACDPELHEALIEQSVAPQIYGIRWMRLMFGREMDLPQLLHLWDCIVHDQYPMELVDYIAVALLIAVRSTVLRGGPTDTLTVLMRYPTVKDPFALANTAKRLRVSCRVGGWAGRGENRCMSNICIGKPSADMRMGAQYASSASVLPTKKHTFQNVLEELPQPGEIRTALSNAVSGASSTKESTSRVAIVETASYDLGGAIEGGDSRELGIFTYEPTHLRTTNIPINTKRITSAASGYKNTHIMSAHDTYSTRASNAHSIGTYEATGTNMNAKLDIKPFGSVCGENVHVRANKNECTNADLEISDKSEVDIAILGGEREKWIKQPVDGNQSPFFRPQHNTRVLAEAVTKRLGVPMSDELNKSSNNIYIETFPQPTQPKRTQTQSTTVLSLTKPSTHHKYIKQRSKVKPVRNVFDMDMDRSGRMLGNCSNNCNYTSMLAKRPLAFAECIFRVVVRLYLCFVSSPSCLGALIS